MKILYLLLLISTQLVHGGQLFKKSCIDSLNGVRQREAAKSRIPVMMNYLDYSDDMEKMVLEQLASYDGCPPKDTLVTKGDIYIYLNTEMNRDTVGTPTSTEGACAMMQCETGENFFGFAVNVYEYAPGNTCSRDRFVNTYGMCERKKEPSRSKYQRKGPLYQLANALDNLFGSG